MKFTIANIQNDNDRDVAVDLFRAAGGDGEAVYNAADKSLTLEIDGDYEDILNSAANFLDQELEPAAVALIITL